MAGPTISARCRRRARPSRWRACRATCWSRSKSWRWPDRGCRNHDHRDRLADRPRHFRPDGDPGRACAVRTAADRAELADLRARRLLRPVVAVPSRAGARSVHRHGHPGVQRLAEGRGAGAARPPMIMGFDIAALLGLFGLTSAFALIGIVLAGWMCWRIADKAGLPGWTGLGAILLTLTGIGSVVSLILLWVFDFMRWPRYGAPSVAGASPSAGGRAAAVPGTLPS